MTTSTQTKTVIPKELKPDPFPLKLTCFERYMFADDRHEYPMTFVIEISLSGDFQFEPFCEAHEFAIARHPLLRAIVRRERGCLVWSGCPPHMPEQIETLQNKESTPQINLKSEPGLRTSVRFEGERTRVSFLIHHACTDGIGAMRFIGDVLGHYGQLTAGRSEDVPELSELDPSLLSRRGELWDPDSVPDRNWKRTLGHLVEFLTSTPSGISKSGSFPKSQRSPFVTRALSRQDLKTIKKAANQLAANPNDLYLAAMFLAIAEWNTIHESNRRGKSYRVLIPASLRTPEHDKMPAANVISYVMINESLKRATNRKQFVKNLSQRMQAILTTADSRLFSRALNVVDQFPYGVSLFASSPLRVCTSVLANVGDVKRQLNCRFPSRRGKCVAGSVVLEGLFGAAPIRRGTGIAISLGTYAGELLINFNCDQSLFSLEESEKFADFFLMQLLELCSQINAGASDE